MSEEDTFSEEPVVGHYVTAEIEEPESGLSDALDEVADDLDLSRRDFRHVTITEYDVAWDQPRTMTIPIDTFESLCAWFLQTDSPDEYVGPGPEEGHKMRSDAEELFETTRDKIPDGPPDEMVREKDD